MVQLERKRKLGFQRSASNVNKDEKKETDTLIKVRKGIIVAKFCETFFK